ncbi:hypothetical protein JCM17844_21560 [Iodidimonas gelatinilytica]|uniref:Uncharacterized protein n=1 Tax=Iodidimonas gelatinilytica TaxID=1236966 RepID=A0A5A7MUG7_9PROT|nr:hypothetical protein [Iodidimonas gelatinilytica]GEQ98519.1 hypothetical protein JCM17844_21560 [Iodidimonas gelatinilytica]
MESVIHTVLTGRLAPLGKHAVPSGIYKTALTGPIHVARFGLSGDEQGDKKHHAVRKKPFITMHSIIMHNGKANIRSLARP